MRKQLDKKREKGRGGDMPVGRGWVAPRAARAETWGGGVGGSLLFSDDVDAHAQADRAE